MNSILYTGEESSFTDEDYKIIEEAEDIIKDNNPDFVPVLKKKHTGLLVFSILFFVLFIFIAFFSTIFALINLSHENIVQGVSSLGVDLSGLTIEQAKEKIISETENRISTEMVFKHNDETYTLHLSEIGGSFDIDDIVNDAYSIGRKGNIFANNFQIINCLLHKKEINATFSYNNDSFSSIVEQINGSMKDGIKEPSYEINDNNLIVTAGKDGYNVDSDKLKN